MSDQKPATPEELALYLAEIAVKEGPWGDRFLDVDQAAALIAEAFERWALARVADGDWESVLARFKARYHCEMETSEARVTYWKRAAVRLAKWRDLTLRQRDQAIAHDRQPYPTAEAYEKVCAARTKWQARAEAAEKRVRELEDNLEASHNGFLAHLEAEHPEWLTRHNSQKCATCALLEEARG